MSKDNFIRLRVAGWEKDYIQRKAQSANLSLSDLLPSLAALSFVNGMKYAVGFSHPT
mgnify:CR=1 FL=1